MKVIPTRVHGILDYTIALLFIAIPYILDVHTMAGRAFVISGFIMLIYSLLTHYELGILHIIPMKDHLTLDLISAIALIASPWVLKFSQYVYLPHVFLGLIEILIVALSISRPKVISQPEGSKIKIP